MRYKPILINVVKVTHHMVREAITEKKRPKSWHWLEWSDLSRVFEFWELAKVSHNKNVQKKRRKSFLMNLVFKVSTIQSQK